MKLMDDEKADVVYGQRSERRGESAFKRLSAHLFYRLLNSLVDVEIPLDTGDFRLMSRRTLDELNRMPEQHRFIRGMVSWIGFRQVPLKYQRHERFAGETKYPLKKMLRFAFDAISGFSIVPSSCHLSWFYLLPDRIVVPWLDGLQLPFRDRDPGLDDADDRCAYSWQRPIVRFGTNWRISGSSLHAVQEQALVHHSRDSVAAE